MQLTHSDNFIKQQTARAKADNSWKSIEAIKFGPLFET